MAEQRPGISTTVAASVALPTQAPSPAGHQVHGGDDIGPGSKTAIPTLSKGDRLKEAQVSRDRVTNTGTTDTNVENVDGDMGIVAENAEDDTDLCWTHLQLLCNGGWFYKKMGNEKRFKLEPRFVWLGFSKDPRHMNDGSLPEALALYWDKVSLFLCCDFEARKIQFCYWNCMAICYYAGETQLRNS